MIYLLQTQIKETILNSLSKDELKHTDKYLYVVSQVNKYNAKNGINGWVNISSRLMQRKLTSNRYNQIVSRLIQLGVLERIDRYRVPQEGIKGFAKSYRIGSQFWLNQLIIEDSIDRRFSEKVLEIEKEQNEVSFVNDKVVNHLIKTNNRLIFHSAECQAEIASITDPAIRAKRLVQLDQILNSDRTKITQPSQSRVHNWISRLPKFFRSFLSLDGERLVSIDVKNSQMIHLSSLLGKLANSPELDKFRVLCESGVIYEYIMTVTGYKGSRNEFKPAFYKQILFSKNSNMIRYKMFKSFAKVFPQVAELLTRVKIEDHSQLARMMQKEEANIIINDTDSVVSTLMANGIDCITLHDSVIVRESDADRAELLMSRTYKQKGITVSLSTDYWTAETLLTT